MYKWWRVCDRLVATSVCISCVVRMLFFTYVCFLVILFCLSLFHIFLLLYWCTVNKVAYIRELRDQKPPRECLTDPVGGRAVCRRSAPVVARSDSRPSRRPVINGQEVGSLADVGAGNQLLGPAPGPYVWLSRPRCRSSARRILNHRFVISQTGPASACSYDGFLSEVACHVTAVNKRSLPPYRKVAIFLRAFKIPFLRATTSYLSDLHRLCGDISAPPIWFEIDFA